MSVCVGGVGWGQQACNQVWACMPAGKYVLYAALFIQHTFLRNHLPCLARAYYHRNILEHCFLCSHPMLGLPCYQSPSRQCCALHFGVFVEPKRALATVYSGDMPSSPPSPCPLLLWPCLPGNQTPGGNWENGGIDLCSLQTLLFLSIGVIVAWGLRDARMEPGYQAN